MVVSKAFAFVLMPFDQAFDDVYRLAIQAAAADCGIVAERVDEQRFSESILERVYRQIKISDFIIADMTGQNPNVFYEVGYAPAHNKLCTLLTQDVSDIPFDLKHHRHIVYGSSVNGLKQSLINEFEWLKKESSIKESPISCELKDSWADLNERGSSGIVNAHITFMISNKTNKRSPDIEAIYLITSKNWTFSQTGESCASLADEGDKARVRHFIKTPIPRLSPGAWAQIKVLGEQWVFPERGELKIKEEYRFQGSCWLEIVTSEGTYSSELRLDLNTADIPF